MSRKPTLTTIIEDGKKQKLAMLAGRIGILESALHAAMKKVDNMDERVKNTFVQMDKRVRDLGDTMKQKVDDLTNTVTILRSSIRSLENIVRLRQLTNDDSSESD